MQAIIKLRKLFNVARAGLGRWFAPLIWAFVCLLLAFIFSRTAAAISSISPYDLTIKVWNSDEKSAVISYFFDPKLNISYTALDTLILRNADALGSAGALKESSHENAKVCAGSYSAFFESSISTGGTPINATAIAAGGDFFMVHPLKLISGAYPDLSRTDISQVLLDETLAWQLFGSTQIEGMTVIISQKTYSVSGIFQKDLSRLNKYAKMPERMFIIPFYKSNSDTEIFPTMFEVLAQNPVKGFAQTALKSAVTSTLATEDNLYIKEFPLRLSFVESLKTLKDLPSIAMDATPYSLPYWENAQRGLELFSALNALLLSLALLYLAIFILTALFKGLLYLRFNFKKVCRGIASLVGICYNRIRVKIRSLMYKKEIRDDR